MSYLGLDTSNYTTSAALLTDESIRSLGKLLPVPEGALGLRQSDALFHHTKALPGLLEDCLSGTHSPLEAVGVSERPRDRADSYMPCFLAGILAGTSAALAAGVPLYGFTHQAGHAAAAIYSTGQFSLLEQPFLCLHYSGGTTDCLLVRPHREKVLEVELLYSSLDLKAGQAVDRVGGLLGLPFPAGPALSQLAEGAEGDYAKLCPTLRNGNVSLSGLQNKAAQQLAAGLPPAEIAAYCLHAIAGGAQAMLEAAFLAKGNLPVLLCGGVMASSVLRRRLGKGFEGSFAAPEYSRDNAAGIALLCKVRCSY